MAPGGRRQRRPAADAGSSRRCRADAALLVTADHGGLNVGPDARVDLATDPRLRAGVDLVAGEPRVRYLHTVPGAVRRRRGGLARRARATGADVLTRDEAIDRGLFGPVPGAHRARIGDVVVICTGPTRRARQRRTSRPRSPSWSASTARCQPAETAIPLLRVRG